MYTDTLTRFRTNDTVAFARTMLGFHPDPIQAQVLDPSIRRGILNGCRQWGKSTTLAVKAAHHAFTHPKSLTICISPCGRQSTAFIDKCRVKTTRAYLAVIAKNRQAALDALAS